MKNKNWIADLLCLVLVFSVLFTNLTTASAKTEDTDLQRAVSLKIVRSIPQKKSITAKEFFTLTDKVVKITAPKKLSKFKKTYAKARKSNKKLSRYDAMVIILAAAEALGQDELNNRVSWNILHQKIGEKCWDSISWDADLFGNTASVPSMEWSREASAYFYSFGRMSIYNGKTIFDYDKKSNSMRTGDLLTYKDALKALVRFHDSIGSNFKVVKRNAKSKEDKKYLKSVSDKTDSILNSMANVSYTGKAYYISNSGSDENDGLSPDTPWETFAPLYNVSKGDCVFFERGGVWRGTLYANAGVTYSAYGQGEKPRIYHSPESGADPSKWTLWYDKNGTKIWKYYIKLNDLGGIVFDDGSSYASRVYSVWKDNDARVWDNLKKKFDIASELKYDLQFYCGYPEGFSSYPFPVNVPEVDMKGDVYLRCDSGNPGELYKEIEFQCKSEPNGYIGIVCCLGDGCVIDNLCLKYSDSMGISLGENENITIQNCEVAYVGGCSLSLGEHDNVPVAGEGIRLDGRNNKAIGNYVHDCFDGGIILEPDLVSTYYDGSDKADRIWGDVQIEGNVITRCMSGILIGVHCEDKIMPKVGTVTIKDNDILYSGYGWSGDSHYDFTWKTDDYNGNAITFWDDDYSHGKYLVENNRLYSARAALVHMGLKGKNVPVFNNNSYMQNKNGILLFSTSSIKCAVSDYAVKDCCKNNLKDKKAKYLSVEK